MKNKYKVSLGVISILLMVGMASPSFAKGNVQNIDVTKSYNKQLVEHLEGILKLNETQKEKISRVRKSYKEKLLLAMQEKKVAKRAFESALSEGPNDQNLPELFEAKEKTRSNLVKLRFNRMLEVRKILSVEQRKKYKAAKQAFDKAWDAKEDIQ